VLTFEDVVPLSKMAKTRKLEAGEIYIEQGAVNMNFAYIKKGLIRNYLLKENGEEVTLMLRWENQFFASNDAIVKKIPSRLVYQALEETLLVELNFENSQEIIDRNPRLSALRNALLLQMLNESTDRIEAFISLSAQERYLKLVKEKANIINRVPNKHLATFLGITPVSLSRIRKRIASEKR
jgi:CRP-like cAMP-binding protein